MLQQRDVHAAAFQLEHLMGPRLFSVHTTIAYQRKHSTVYAAFNVTQQGKTPSHMPAPMLPS